MLAKSKCPSQEELISSLDSMAEISLASSDHIGSCRVCQSKLEELAAESSVWQDTEEILTAENHNDTVLASSIAQAICPLASKHQDGDQHVLHAEMELERLRTTLEPASHPELLGRIGRYELEQLVGHGGMGLVFRARDIDLHRVVAVKTISAAFLTQPTARQRFLREARASASLVHPHIVAVHDIIQDSPIPAIVMQFVAGPTLQEFLNEHGALQWREALRLGLQLCDALDQAHEKGLIHRDIKPGNVLLEGGCQRAMLTDFGLVRALDSQTMTQTGAITGTPEYMSPEQAWGRDLDCRSDLFSLGALLYTMLTDAPPFRAEAPMATLNLVCNSQQKPLHQTSGEIPKEVCRLVDKLLEKQPRRRHGSASEVRKAMTQLLQSDIVLRPKNTTTKLILLIGSVLLACFATVGGLFVWQKWLNDVALKEQPDLPGKEYSYPKEPSELESGFAVIAATDSRIAQVEALVSDLETSMRHSDSTPATGFDPMQQQIAEIELQLERLESEDFQR